MENDYYYYHVASHVVNMSERRVMMLTIYNFLFRLSSCSIEDEAFESVKQVPDGRITGRVLRPDPSPEGRA